MRYIPYQTPMYNGTAYQSPPTIGSIGGYGYSPYQNNYYYNQYFNPYYLRQQQEYQRRVEIQESNNQACIWADLIQCRNNALGYSESREDILEQIKIRAETQQQMNNDDQFMDRIHEISQKVFQKQAEIQAMQENVKRQQEVMSQEPQEKKSFYAWLHEDAQQRFMESQYAEMNKQQRNTSKLYDSNAYNQLLGTHDSVFSSFNALNKEVTIDDMEIQVNLPERLKRERDIRRQRFAESLKRGMA